MGQSQSIVDALCVQSVCSDCDMISTDSPSEEFASKYIMHELVGEGAFSRIYKAKLRSSDAASDSKSLPDRYAVKVVTVVPGSGAASEHAAIASEVAILRRCCHPTIERLYDFFESSCEYRIVIELLEGPDLFDALAVRTFYTENDARGVFRRVLQALEYLHVKQCIVHRDIKPENFVLTAPLGGNSLGETSSWGDFWKREEMGGSPCVKLVDFGLATEVTGNRVPGSAPL